MGSLAAMVEVVAGAREQLVVTGSRSREKAYLFTGEDLAAISPYLTDHIMRFGTYTTTELTARPDAFDPHLDVEFETEEEVPAAA
ncbi:hypothetical protein [Streptomyces avermitilis]|uniref:hypothetical protein n=1 Tax=Streptomyces avermitilis TaxID=33903 RepID=UPI003715C6C6